MVGLADAVFGADSVGAQEHPVKAHPLQGRLGQGPHETLRKAPQPAAQAIHFDTFGIGEFLHGVDPHGCNGELVEAAQCARLGATMEPASSRMFSPGGSRRRPAGDGVLLLECLSGAMP